MLSLLGSLQPDPFSPRHTIQPHTQKAQQNDSGTEDEVDEEESGESESGSDSDSAAEDDSESDTFQQLGKRKDLHDLKQKSATEQSSTVKKKRK